MSKLIPFLLCSQVGHVDILPLWLHLGHDRFESTASAGRRIPSVSPIDLPLAIPEDPLPSSGRRKTVEVCVEPTFQNGSQNKRSSDMHRQMLSYYSKPKSGSYYTDPHGSLPLCRNDIESVEKHYVCKNSYFKKILHGARQCCQKVPLLLLCGLITRVGINHDFFEKIE